MDLNLLEPYYEQETSDNEVQMEEHVGSADQSTIVKSNEVGEEHDNVSEYFADDIDATETAVEVNDQRNNGVLNRRVEQSPYSLPLATPDQNFSSTSYTVMPLVAEHKAEEKRSAVVGITKPGKTSQRADKPSFEELAVHIMSIPLSDQSGGGSSQVIRRVRGPYNTHRETVPFVPIVFYELLFSICMPILSHGVIAEVLQKQTLSNNGKPISTVVNKTTQCTSCQHVTQNTVTDRQARFYLKLGDYFNVPGFTKVQLFNLLGFKFVGGEGVVKLKVEGPIDDEHISCYFRRVDLNKQFENGHYSYFELVDKLDRNYGGGFFRFYRNASKCTDDCRHDNLILALFQQ